MVRGQIHDAPALLEKAKGTMGPKSSADEDWWKGNVRLK
jgi:hypothetical protein